MATCLAVRSRQPVASTSERAVRVLTPSRFTVVTAKAPSGKIDARVTKVRVSAGMPSAKNLSMKRSAYSGPDSFSPKRCRPKPSWMHCFSIPPSLASRSMSSAAAPCSLAEMAAASPAGPPPMTITS